MLTELFDKASEKVSGLLKLREGLLANRNTLLEALAKAEEELSKSEAEIQAAVRERDSLAEALKVVPEAEAKPERDIEDMRRKRQAVFMQMRQIPNAWIKPFGIAALTGLDVEEVCSILRRASKIEGVPLEHNGERGIGSMYRWVGEPLTK